MFVNNLTIKISDSLNTGEPPATMRAEAGDLGRNQAKRLVQSAATQPSTGRPTSADMYQRLQRAGSSFPSNTVLTRAESLCCVHFAPASGGVVDVSRLNRVALVRDGSTPSTAEEVSGPAAADARVVDLLNGLASARRCRHWALRPASGRRVARRRLQPRRQCARARPAAAPHPT